MAEQLGKTIRILRQAKGLTTSDMARRSKISVPFLSLVEKGTREPSLDVLRRLSATLGIPSDALLLTAMGPQSDLTSTKNESVAIAETVHQLVEIESKLRSLLARKESPGATKRRHAGPDRGRGED